MSPPNRFMVFVLAVLLLTCPFNAVSGEHLEDLHRSDAGIMIKDLKGKPVGLIYLFLGVNQTIYFGESLTTLSFQISFQTWGNETHLPPIKQIELVDLSTGYGTYEQGEPPVKNLILHPEPIVLHSQEVWNWQSSQVLDTEFPETYAHMKIDGGIIITTVDGIEYRTPLTIEISSPSTYLSSYEITIFEETITRDSPLYLGADYHGFIYDFSQSVIESNLTINYGELVDDANDLQENVNVLAVQLTDLNASLTQITQENLGLYDQTVALTKQANDMTLQRTAIFSALGFSLLGLLFLAFRSPIRDVQIIRFESIATVSGSDYSEVVLIEKKIYKMDDLSHRLYLDSRIPLTLVTDQSYDEWINEKEFKEMNREAELSEILKISKREINEADR